MRIVRGWSGVVGYDAAKKWTFGVTAERSLRGIARRTRSVSPWTQTDRPRAARRLGAGLGDRGQAADREVQLPEQLPDLAIGLTAGQRPRNRGTPASPIGQDREAYVADLDSGPRAPNGSSPTDTHPRSRPPLA